ncbi:MAG TPA: hypothetical protein VL331_09175 [Croceibacterium sp.]|jgi:hypothetical protein|nr:hypothetical protein [Croceibacterium sp.]
MHIHLPKPLHGWREFIGEVGIIVIGVLIALAAEQAIEALHHRSQVHDAIAALHAESNENRSAFDANVVGLQRSQASVETDLAALDDCGNASRPDRLVPVVQSVWLVPSDHAWIGVRDGALLPLLPAELRDSYFKVNTFKDLMMPGINAIYTERAVAGARVEAMRRGLRDPGLCRDAVVQLLNLQMQQDFNLKDTLALRSFNEDALRGEHLDAVARPVGLDISTAGPPKD